MVESNRRPASQFTRLAVGITVGFVLLHLGLHFFYAHERMVANALTFAKSTFDRSLAVAELQLTHPDIVARLTGPEFSLESIDTPLVVPRRPWPHSDEVRDGLFAYLDAIGFVGAADVRLWFGGGRGPPRLVMQIPIQHRWLKVEARTTTTSWGHSMAGVFWTTMIAVMVWLGVLWATRRVTRHLPRFAVAAENLGRIRVSDPLPENQGPSEIRHASRAFNEMQQRVQTYLEQRTRMLAAFSHDLRTLVTRLQLRTALIDDTAQRGKAEQDIAAVTAILDESLIYARDEQSQEADTDIDLSSLLQTLIDGAIDQGHVASFEGASDVLCRGQPSALTRAFANLIDNAIHYGNSVTVRLVEQQTHLIVDIVDQGPGIPARDHEKVLEPYVRMDASRSRETGGTGLGLAIVHNVVTRHSGSLTFHHKSDGFYATVTLPR